MQFMKEFFVQFFVIFLTSIFSENVIIRENMSCYCIFIALELLYLPLKCLENGGNDFRINNMNEFGN